MLAEGAPLVLGGALLEINAGTLALMLAIAFAHEATAMFDVGYTVSRRVVPPGEQHTHAFLEALRFSIVAFSIALYRSSWLCSAAANKRLASKYVYASRICRMAAWPHSCPLSLCSMCCRTWKNSGDAGKPSAAD
jgi:hypothetical protein